MASSQIFFISAKTEDGLDLFFNELIKSTSSSGNILELDYEQYANGEAMLGWVNSEAYCSVANDIENFKWNTWLERVGTKLATELSDREVEVGHFKMSISVGNQRWRLHQVMSSDEVAVYQDTLESPSKYPHFLMNLRAQGDGKVLESLIDQILFEQTEVELKFTNRAAFQPGKPQPTHRIPEIQSIY